MMEEDVWLVPLLDGSLRIEKPPLLKLADALEFRAIRDFTRKRPFGVVIFAALLITVILVIALELTNNIRYGVTAAAMALSNIGIDIHGRILLPDIPRRLSARWRSGFF